MSRLSNRITLATAALTLTAGVAQAKPEAAADWVELDLQSAKPILRADRPQRTFVKVGVTGKATRQVERAPVNLALVLDRSSSMSGDKIAKAKEAALLVLDRLGPDDIVSIIAYDAGVEVIVPATKVSDRSRIAARIRGLTPRGSTALFAGVSTGLEQVRKFLDNKRVNRVILLSDGQANVGPSSPAELSRLGAAAGREGVAVTTIGLGLGYNEDLMAALASSSDGNHAFVENAEQLANVFELELKDVLSVVAQEIAVKVTVPKGVRPVQILGDVGEIHGQTVVLQMNQLYSGQNKYVLLEVEVTPHAAGQVLELASATVSYADMEAGRTHRVSGMTPVVFHASDAAVARAENREVMVASVEALAVKANREALALRDQGKVKEAKKRLFDNAAFLDKNAKKYRSPRLQNYSTTNSVDAQNLEGRNWNRRRKSMRKKQYELESQQRY